MKEQLEFMRETITRIRRSLVYRILKPRPPVHPSRFDGPVVVVGSAPVSTMPAGFSNRFHVITVNGSQSVSEKWGVETPDATFMQFNQIEGQTTNAIHVRRVLNGKRTKLLYIVRWPEGIDRLKRGLAAFNYAYDSLGLVNRFQRMALYEGVMGHLNVEINDDMKFSNGITAVFYAILNGAKAVIITGINPDSSGHIYNDANMKRLHASTDKQILKVLIDRNYPLFTADRQVSETSGIPLWTEESIEIAGV